MSYPPLTFVKLPGSPSSSPLRDGSPHLTRSRDATLSSSPLRAARETAVSSPARSAGSQASSGVSASEKRRSFWSDLFANSDSSSQDNEDDEDEDSEHPLRSSLSLFTSSATVHKRKRTAEPSQTARVIASADSFLTTKRPKLAHADDDDDEDDEDGKLELTVSNTARRMDSSSDNGVVILDDDDDVIGTALPHHTPPPSPLSERSSNKEDGNGSPWIKRKRDVVATVKPTALHPPLNLSDDDEDEERSESDKENNDATNDHRRHNVNQKPQPSAKRVDAKEPSSDRTNRDSLVAKNTSSAITADSAKPSKREVVVEIDEADSQANAAGDTASAPRLKFLSPFTEEEVKKWSKARLQAWKQRHRNANSYYYRFTDPTVAQSERKLSRDEHQTFMRRYEEFQRNGWRVGTSWGLFSMALPSRVGYQCANHYRKLLKEGKLNDNSFKLDPKGEVKLIEGADVRGHCGIENALSDVWKTKEVKAIEKYVDKWISEYHDGVSKVLAFPDDDDEANNVDGEDEQQLKEPKAATKAKRCRPQPTVTSFIASCDQLDTSRKVIVLDTTDEEAFDSGHHNRVTQPTKKRKRANSATEKEEEVSEEGRRGLNDSETDGSIDDPIEENIFVYAAQDYDGMDITTTTTTTTTSSTVTSFKRPQNVWKDFIIDPSEPLHAGRKPRTAAGRGRGLAGKAKQLDLSHFIPGLKPAPVIVEAEDNKSLIEKTVIPRPIPRSWAKVVQPFDYEAARGKKATPGSRYLETTIEALELEKLGSFEAILMDPPWDLSPRVPASGKVEPKRGNKGERLITPEELGRWPITDKLIPKGFLFIWTEKELIPRVLTMAQKWGFHYVENFAWVKFDVNNKIHTEDYAYFRKSKLTLLMLRKPGTPLLSFLNLITPPQDVSHRCDIELRHQRNPDVKFDFVRKGRERLPFVYDVIETLLPTAKYNPKTGTGKMLQLWCLPKQRRSGWTSVHLTEEEEEEESAGESPSPAAE